MKDKKEINAGDYSTNINADGDVYLFLQNTVPTELVDQKVEELVELIRKARFFSEFDHISESLHLGERLVNGDLAIGSNKARNIGLAWCARLLARSDHIDRAEKWLGLAKSLGNNSEITIAEAFLTSQEGNKSSALQKLSAIETPASRSAALMVTFHHEGAEGALRWLVDTGYTIDCLDSDGKSFLLSHQLELGYWREAAETVDSIAVP